MTEERGHLRLIQSHGHRTGYEHGSVRGPVPLHSRVVQTADGLHIGLQGNAKLNPEMDMGEELGEALTLVIWRTHPELEAPPPAFLSNGMLGQTVFALFAGANPAWWAPSVSPVEDSIELHLDRLLMTEICFREGMKVLPVFDGLTGLATPLMIELGQQIARLAETDERPTRQYLDALVTLLVVNLADMSGQHSVAVQRPQLRKGGLAGWQVRRTTEHIHAHLHQTIALNELAAIAGLSPFHFARAFKQSVGDPPHRYQIRKRLEKACEMLAGTDMPVIDIAAAVGYETPQTLSRLFRREFGVSPSFYRREKTR